MADPTLSDKELKIIKSNLARELKEDLSIWARNRFWLVALLIAGLTFFGVKSVVRDVLEDDVRTVRQETSSVIAEAKTAAALTTDATKQAKEAAIGVQQEIKMLSNEVSQFEKKLEEATNNATHLKEMLSNTRKQADEIATKFSEISSGNTMISKQLQGQVDKLKNAMLIVAAKGDQNTEVISLAEKIQTDSKITTSNISDNFMRASLAKYNVSVTGTKDRPYNRAIFEALRERGLSPRYGTYDGVQNAVYIGTDIPLDIAVFALKLAKKHLPELRYVGLYNEVNKLSLTVGGGGAPAHFTVTDSQLQSLLNPDQTLEEFHSKLKSF